MLPPKGTPQRAHYQKYQNEFRKKSYQTVPLVLKRHGDEDLIEALVGADFGEEGRNEWLKRIIRKALRDEKRI